MMNHTLRSFHIVIPAKAGMTALEILAIGKEFHP
jgi:hypothetical protein